MDEIYEFYNNGAEIGRLERGLGKVEFYRTKEILLNYIEGKKTIYDIGGGIGMYAAWLAKMGHDVHLVELAENAVAYAKENMMKDCHFEAEAGDAKSLNLPSETADVVLLMGPLYHLCEKEDRLLALRESFRVLKEGGLLVAAGISKYSSATWALSVYGEKNDFIDDPVFFDMLKGEIMTGCHNRPKEYPRLIAKSYFTTASEMRGEISEAGFEVLKTHAVEGCVWLTPHLDEKWADEACRNNLMNLVRMTESDEEMMGISPHFLVVARKME